MALEASTREELHRLIDEMSDDEVLDLVDMVNMRFDDGAVSLEEEAIFEEARLERLRGLTVSFDEIRSSKEA